ncbi:hypothetical protein EJ08DRAFT_270409 [Tothia fuscella]|uniref:F-box domain-containing protein n=1 Tax=Tothia fuscella TaxID=1048955 RepID=A0A9P4NQ58_9PEZI|nr:hypothetical protein EJ08DRAFT_270409 [Tothia fuscella]
MSVLLDAPYKYAALLNDPNQIIKYAATAPAQRPKPLKHGVFSKLSNFAGNLFRRPKSPTPFHLLELPAEIRLMIYEEYISSIQPVYEILVEPPPVLLASRNLFRSRRDEEWEMELEDHNLAWSKHSKAQCTQLTNLLLTSHQIYREASPIFYNQPVILHSPRTYFGPVNDFLARAIYGLPSFIDRFPVRELTLVVGGGHLYRDTLVAIFAGCLPWLKKLNFVVAGMEGNETSWDKMCAYQIIENVAWVLSAAPRNVEIGFNDEIVGRGPGYQVGKAYKIWGNREERQIRKELTEGLGHSLLNEKYSAHVLSKGLIEKMLRSLIEQRENGVEVGFEVDVHW